MTLAALEAAGKAAFGRARRRLWLGFGCMLLALAPVGYTKVMARLAPGTPPEMATSADQADLIRVDKSDRRLELWRGDRLLGRYRIALGAAADAGAKAREGDERTPEGRYVIDWRNPRSMAHLSLHVSYPDAADRAAAGAAGQPPGGNIMIHGLPNGWGWLGRFHHLRDWTDGCMAVTNAEMREIWASVPDGTPIEIAP